MSQASSETQWSSGTGVGVSRWLADTAVCLAADPNQIDTAELVLLEENVSGPVVDEERDFRVDSNEVEGPPHLRGQIPRLAPRREDAGDLVRSFARTRQRAGSLFRSAASPVPETAPRPAVKCRDGVFPSLSAWVTGARGLALPKPCYLTCSALRHSIRAHGTPRREEP